MSGSRRSSKSSKRKYGSAAARAKEAAKKQGPGGGGGTMFQNIPQDTDFYNPEEGKITLRFLPYIVTDPKHPDGDMAPVDDIWYKRPFKRFRQLGSDNKPFISPRSIGKPCPVTEYYMDAKADPSIPEKETKKYKAQDCVMYNVQIVDRKKGAGDPMFFWMSYHCFEKQLKKELLDPDNEDFLAFMDLEGGFDLRIRWEKEKIQVGKRTIEFLVADNIQFIERDEDIDEDILDDVVNLDECLVIKPYDELKNIFLEIDDDVSNDEDEEEEEEEEEEKPSRPSRKRKGKTKDEEEKPSRRRGKKKTEPEPEPEPEPDDEKEDECPNGFEFGYDFDSERKCKRCKIKEECGDAYDFIEADKEKEEKVDKKSSSKKSDDENKCEYGHTFGVDCDKETDCDDCKIWDDCMDEQERLENE